MKIPAILSLVFLTSSLLQAGPDFADSFSEEKMEGRAMMRGEWVLTDEGARCTADPELYKKFKDHGPIVRWKKGFQDGTVEFSFKPEDCQSVVFTLNGDGHVFRWILAEKRPGRIFGWAGPSETTDNEALTDKKTPPLTDLNGTWVKGKVAIKGDTATVVIGDQTYELKHPSLARKKEEITLGFAFGTLTIREMKLSGATE